MASEIKKDRRALLRVAGEEVKSHRHSVNPFTEGWKPEMTKREKRMDLAKMPAIKNEAGERVEGVLLIPIERDSGRFTKLFHDEWHPLGQLSLTARKVLDFAMKQALPNNGVVYMPVALALVECRFKQPKSFYDGVNELILYEYLARHERKSFYFINPRRFITGRRNNLKHITKKPKGQA